MSLTSADRVIESMSPPEEGFGYLYFSHMIPPFKSEYPLILGCATHTIVELISRIWGECIHECVDINNDPAAEAKEYVSKCRRSFDYIVVDLWNDDKVCEFIYEPGFVKNLHKISTRLISINIPVDDRQKAVEVYTQNGFTYDRHDVCFGNAVMFFHVNN